MSRIVPTNRSNRVNGSSRAARHLAMALALGVVVAELSPLGTAAARAASSSWTGAVSTDWNNVNNWSGNVFPTGAYPDGVLTVNTSTGNIATITANSAFTPSDINVGVGGGASGRVAQISGSFSGGNGNWAFVGCNGGTGVYNLAETTTSGGTLTGYGIGSGSMTVSGNLYIGGRYFDANGTGTFNMNTTGTLQAGLIDMADGAGGTGNGTLNLDNGTARSTGEFWTGAWGVGTTNQSGGTATSASWFVVGRSGTGVYNLTGGTVNAATAGGNVTVGSFGGASGTVNVSGGTMSTPNAMYIGEGGTGTLNLSGTGLVSAGNTANGLRLGVNSGAVGTVNLDGGTLLVPTVTQGGGSGTFNFNGGKLKASGGSATFMAGLTAANVRNGGAVIDSNGAAITIGQVLQHSSISGDSATDGGLTKVGSGGVTLTASNTFNGPTTVAGGSLIVGGSGDVNSSSGITVNGSGAKFVSTSSTAVSPTVTVTSGGVDGTGTINTVNVAGNAANTVANGNGGTGTLTLGSLTFAGAGNFSLNVGGTTPEVAVTTLTTSGAGNVVVNATNSSWLPGTYDLISYGTLGGAGIGAFQKGTISGLSGRQSATLSNADGFIALTIAGDNPKWTGALSSNWSTATQSSPKNWKLITSGTGTDYISGDLTLFDDTASNFTVNVADATVTPTSVTFNNSANNYVLNGPGAVAGSGSVTKNGTGTLTINNANTYGGGTVLSAGTLNVNNASAIGTGTLTVAGGTTIDNTSGSAITLSTNNAQVWAGDFTFAGSNALNMGTGTATLSDNRTVTVNAGTLTVGSIAGSTAAAGLTKAGAGTMVITGNGTYTGPTNVTGGTLTVSGSVTGASATNVNGGTLAVSGTVTAPGTSVNSGALVINSGGTVTSSTGDTWVGINGTASLQVNGGGTMNGNTILVGGYNNTGGTGTVTVATGGTLSTKNWLVVGFANGGNGTLNVNGGTVNVHTTTGAGNLEMGTWDAGTTSTVNVNGGAVNVLNGASILMSVNTNHTGDTTFNQNSGNVTFYSDNGTTLGGGTVIVGNAGNGTHTYNLNGGTLTTVGVTHSAGTGVMNFNGGTLKAAADSANFVAGLTTANVRNGGALIDTNGHNVTVSQPLVHSIVAGDAVSDGGLTKNGAGTMVLSGVSTYTGATVINGGTVRLASGSPPAAVGSYSFDVDQNNNPTSQGGLNQGDVVVNGGSGGSAMNGSVNHSDNAFGGDAGGSVSIVAGKFGNGISFDGLGSSVDIASKIVDQSGTGTWTTSMWIQTSSVGSSMLSKNHGASTWQSGDAVFYLATNPISSSGGSLPTAVRYGGGFVQGDPSPVTVTDGAWHMLTYVDNAGTKTVYVDGVPVTMTMTGFDNADSTTQVRVGYNTDNLANFDGNQPFTGSLDELKFYGAALSAAQVQQLFASNALMFTGGQQYLPTNTAVNLAASGAALDLNDNNQTVGSVQGVAGTSLSLGMGTLTAGGDGTSTTFAGTIAGSGGITKAGSGAWALTGANTYAGRTTVNAGRLVLRPSAAGVVSSGGGAAVNGGRLVFDYAGGSSPAGTLVPLINASAASGFTTGQFVSSTLDAHHTLGYLDNASASAFTVMWTYYGDLNLDGRINADDYALIDRGAAKHLTGWVNGDVNYDGSVTSADYLLMDAAYGSQTGTLSPDFLAMREAQFGAGYISSLVAAVPEPTSIGLVGIGALALAGRRRRRM